MLISHHTTENVDASASKLAVFRNGNITYFEKPQPARHSGENRKTGREWHAWKKITRFSDFYPKFRRSLFLVLAGFLLSGCPDEKPARPDEKSRVAKKAKHDFNGHVEELKPDVPAGFHIFIEPPFTVIGNESEEIVRMRAEILVRGTVAFLKSNYFPKDPEKIVDIWLFKDAESYERYVREIFNDEPDTPFGYYSEKHNALIMNISTGGGTLVHEIVHPFMAANFPECPPWFNEGLASLYEQSKRSGNDLIGLTNWRLPGLKAAIRNKTLPSFEKLASMNEYEFYDDGNNENYAQARYLCYYLQKKGLLKYYYHKFSANAARDPSGYATLKTVLQTEDIPRFQREWEEWVLNL